MKFAVVVIALFGVAIDAASFCGLDKIDLVCNPIALQKAHPDKFVELQPHLSKVCEIMQRRCKLEIAAAADPNIIQPAVAVVGKDGNKRSLLDSLSKLTDGTSFSTALKAIDALGKASSVFNEVKNLAPEVHDHLKGTIDDISGTLQDIINSVAGEVKTATGAADKPVNY